MRNFGIETRKRANTVSILVLAFSIFGVIILITRAAADDSIARFGAGGITFLKSKDIRMLEEVLEISTNEVRVKFRFLNESPKDIHTAVAFPLPPYPPFLADGLSGASNPSLIIATFKVWVEGQPVKTNFDRRAVVNGRDVTAQLRELGLSDEQIFRGAELTDGQMAALEKLDLGKGDIINWEIAETAFWEQTFPSGKEIVVEHAYEPAVGRGYVPHLAKSGSSVRHENGPCLDERTKRALKSKHKDLEENPEYVLCQDVEYVLGTGRNWKGSIGEFTLRIAKETPDTIISLCFPGKPKKVSPTVYEFHHKDFVPPDKVVVYFY